MKVAEKPDLFTKIRNIFLMDTNREPIELSTKLKIPLCTALGKDNYTVFSLFYKPHALSWAEAGAAFKSTFQVDHKRHEVAMAAGHYMLAGDFFENHQEYHKFLDMMENPRLFEGYKNLVIDRAEYQVDSCGVDRSIIFPSLTAEIT